LVSSYERFRLTVLWGYPSKSTLLGLADQLISESDCSKRINIFSEVREIKERGEYDEEIGNKTSKEG
jgi:hypothetical protein